MFLLIISNNPEAGWLQPFEVYSFNPWSLPVDTAGNERLARFITIPNQRPCPTGQNRNHRGRCVKLILLDNTVLSVR